LNSFKLFKPFNRVAPFKSLDRWLQWFHSFKGPKQCRSFFCPCGARTGVRTGCGRQHNIM